MPLPFRLYVLINKEAAIRYPYVAICKESPRLIFISPKQILIIDPAEIIFFEEDYAPLSQTLLFDLPLLDSKVADYIGPFEYAILTRFTNEKHITLTYHSPTNEGPKDYDIYTGYPEERAQKLIRDIYPMFTEVRDWIL